MHFPFEPKSTAHLQQGHYWAIQLSNGRFACGLVLARATCNGKPHRTMFLGGLLDWSGSTSPTSAGLKNAKLLQSGFMHVKAIRYHGQQVLGQLEEAWTIPPEVEYTGLTVDGPPLWGLAFIRAVAEHHFGNAEWSDQAFQKRSAPHADRAE